MSERTPPASRVEYLDLGDEIAVGGTRNQARDQISSLAGVEYVRVSVRRAWMRPCDCEGCVEDGPSATHDFDEYWIFCAKDHPQAIGWWVG